MRRVGLGRALPAIALGLLAGAGTGRALADGGAGLAARGAALFVTKFTPERGLGPLFNHQSCVGCHAVPSTGGMGPEGLGTATRVGRLTPSGFDALSDRGGPVARARSVNELGVRCDLAPGISAHANVTSVRNAPGLYGSGLVAAIPDAQIVAGAVPRGDGVHGRAHRIRGADGAERIGRFGWKADTVTLQQFVADAFRNELGITSPLAPVDLAPSGRPDRSRCAGEGAGLEDDGSIVDAVTAFLAALPPPSPRAAWRGAAVLFRTIGCAACHSPSLASPAGPVRLYSDLLLHDLGPDLDDKVVQGQASGRDWRTTPLWGLRLRPRLLHDGRARTVTEAIAAHGGEATVARQRFNQLLPAEREVLLAFLSGL